jgi:hypothetical protein
VSEAWYAANPAIAGGTISLDVLEAESEQPNRAAFIRSSVNLWLASSQGWIAPGVWDALATTDPMPNGGVLAVEVSQDESRYIGLRGAMNPQGKCQVTVAFVKDTLQDCITAIENEVRDQTTRLLVTPTLELSMPAKLVSRMQIVGNRELIRWTSLARNAIIEGKVAHDGSTLLAQHIARAVAVKVQGAITLVIDQVTRPYRVGARAVLGCGDGIKTCYNKKTNGLHSQPLICPWVAGRYLLSRSVAASTSAIHHQRLL